MISIINGSPRINSNSSYFIDIIIKNLNDSYTINRIYREKTEDVIQNMEKSDVIILVFPLYVDAPPSKLLELMEQYECKKRVYAVSNCGFLESKQNNVAIDIIKNWSNDYFMGSFKIGAGGVLGHDSIISKLLSPLFKYKFHKFTKYINHSKKINLSASLILSKKMFCFCANHFFKKEINKYL